MTASELPAKQSWWCNATVYQIWPASYKDLNGDDLGDIPGIISTLDYLKGLGVDAIWLSPIYDSPQVDRGYDVKNYEAVYPPFGTLDDVDDLIKECHDWGIRLLMDLCITYTSDEHPWFQESSSSRENAKRDWYIWRPPKYINGQRCPPNNWRAAWGGSCWTWNETTEEYYFHLYSEKQPDVNWENVDLRAEVYRCAIEFWLDRGIDGFRIDTVSKWSKDMTFPDTEITDSNSPYQQPAPESYSNRPPIYDYIREIRKKIQLHASRDILLVGELGYLPDINGASKYISKDHLDLVLTFNIMDVDKNKTQYGHIPFILPAFKSAVTAIQSFTLSRTGGTIFLENHDQPRSISRFGNADYYHSKSGKLLCMLLLTLSGTLFLYQGQEIGMINVPKTWDINEFKDIAALNYYREVESQSGGDKEALKQAMRMIQCSSRDNARTPVQWDDSPNAGFTTASQSWMKVNDNYTSINVARQAQETYSLLTFYKELLHIRKEHADLFIHGEFEGLDHDNESTFSFVKRNGDKKALVVLNFTLKPQPLHLDVAKGEVLRLLIGNEVDKRLDDCLLPYEGRVYLIENETTSTS